MARVVSFRLFTGAYRRLAGTTATMMKAGGSSSGITSSYGEETFSSRSPSSSPRSRRSPSNGGGVAIQPPYQELDWETNQDDYHSLSDFNVVTFNLLAPCYKRLPRRNLVTGRGAREADHVELWRDRMLRTLSFFKEEIYGKSDIIALQEYWLDSRYTEVFESEVRAHGYEVRLLQRTGRKTDAVAIMVKSDVFEVVGSQNIFLCSIGDRVALMLWLRHRETGKDMLIANTHLSFPHNQFDIANQLSQVKTLTTTMEEFAECNNIAGAMRIITGDFNAETTSPTCEHLRRCGFQSSFDIKPPVNIADISRSGSAHTHVRDHTHVEQASASIAADVHSKEVRIVSQAETGVEVDDKTVLTITQRATAEWTLHEARENNDRNHSSDIAETYRDHQFAPQMTAEDTDAMIANVIAASKSSRPQSATALGEQTSSATAAAAAEVGEDDEGRGKDLKFVSHRTHEHEDLGVDHIFIRPEVAVLSDSLNGEPLHGEIASGFLGFASLFAPFTGHTANTPYPPSPSLQATKEDTNSGRCIVGNEGKHDKTTTTGEVDSSREVQTEEGEQHHVQTATSSSIKEADAFDDVLSVFIDGTVVLPRHVACGTWPHGEFTVSDHRPVRSKIVLGRRKSALSGGNSDGEEGQGAVGSGGAGANTDGIPGTVGEGGEGGGIDKSAGLSSDMHLLDDFSNEEGGQGKDISAVSLNTSSMQILSASSSISIASSSAHKTAACTAAARSGVVSGSGNVSASAVDSTVDSCSISNSNTSSDGGSSRKGNTPERELAESGPTIK